MAVFHLAVPSTNPFVAGAIPPEMATNPFQTNGRAPAAGVYALRVLTYFTINVSVLLRHLCYFDVTQLHCLLAL